MCENMITTGCACRAAEWINKTEVIHDPLGQPTVVASNDFHLILKSLDGRVTCVRVVITTSRDCGRPRGLIPY